MAERKAVIKNADMSEDMQQDAVDCASQALEKYNIEKVRSYIENRKEETFASRILLALNENIKFNYGLIFYDRILLLTSRKNLTRNTTQRGIVLLVAISGPMSHMKQSISSISI